MFRRVRPRSSSPLTPRNLPSARLLLPQMPTKFKDLVDLESHQASHALPSCLPCRRTFVDDTALKEHLKNSTHHQEDLDTTSNRTPCTECSRKFRDVSALQQHWGAVHHSNPTPLQLTHASTTTKPSHKCTSCASRFTTKSALKEHEKSNLANKSCALLKVPCGDCVRAFRTDDALDSHRMSTGHNASVWACTDCDETFLSNPGILRHRGGTGHRVSHKTLPCVACTRVFASYNTLKRHRFAAHGHVNQQDTSISSSVFEKVEQEAEGDNVDVKISSTPPVGSPTSDGRDNIAPISPVSVSEPGYFSRPASSRSSSCGRQGMPRMRPKHVTWAQNVDVRVF